MQQLKIKAFLFTITMAAITTLAITWMFQARVHFDKMRQIQETANVEAAARLHNYLEKSDSSYLAHKAKLENIAKK